MPNETTGLCMNCMSQSGEHIVCPHCGYDKNTPHDPDCLAPGTAAGGRYLIGRPVRKNGEGITYTGFDREQRARVWVREYYPRAIAQRSPATGSIAAKGAFGAQYKALMSDFVDICTQVRRMSVSEPVVPLDNMFADHGTAYAVYKDLRLTQFETWLTRQGGKLPAAEARDMLLPVYHCLSNLHEAGVIHRGVSPYTLYIDDSGKLYLWDFCLGAARTAGSELDAELFNGYSAPEQYSATGWQGAWTDVYGAAALFYRAVSGFVPPKSTMIGPQRPLAPLMDLVMDLPNNISNAVSEAMQTAAEDRTQEIGIFAAQLVQTDLSSTAIYDVNRLNAARIAQENKRLKRAEARQQRKYLTLGLLVTVVALAVVFWFITTNYLSDLITPEQPVSGAASNSISESASGDEDSQAEESPAQAGTAALPSLAGLTAEEVQANPEYQNRQIKFVIREEYHDRYEAGVIFDQSPAAGIAIADGRTVILSVSKGKMMLTMPDLIGKTSDEVSEILAELGGDEIDITFGAFSKYSEGAEPGTVVSTSPTAGTEFDPRNTRIEVFYQLEDIDNSVSEASRIERDDSRSSSRSASETSRNREGPDGPPRRD